MAAGAESSKGTIYRHFSSKEALFEAVLQARIVATMDRTKEMAPGFDGPTNVILARFFDFICTGLVDGGSLVFPRMLLAERYRFSELVSRKEKVVLDRGKSTVRAPLPQASRGETCNPRR